MHEKRLTALRTLWDNLQGMSCYYYGHTDASECAISRYKKCGQNHVLWTFVHETQWKVHRNYKCQWNRA